MRYCFFFVVFYHFVSVFIYWVKPCSDYVRMHASNTYKITGNRNQRCGIRSLFIESSWILSRLFSVCSPSGTQNPVVRLNCGLLRVLGHSMMCLWNMNILESCKASLWVREIRIRSTRSHLTKLDFLRRDVQALHTTWTERRPIKSASITSHISRIKGQNRNVC